MKRGQKASAEQVVLKLRRIEVQTAQGKSLALAQLRMRRSPSRATTGRRWAAALARWAKCLVWARQDAGGLARAMAA